jgi:hypothetical protein
MANITDLSCFIDDIYVPIVSVPSVQSQSVPTVKNGLTAKINVVERSVLLNSLGLDLYNEVQSNLANLNNAPQKIKDLVNGCIYDGMIWEGLKNPKSLIAYAVYYYFLDDVEKGIFAPHGVYKLADSEKEKFSPMYKMAYAWNIFLNKYQSGCFKIGHSHIDQVEYIDFIDTQESIERSLYQFLFDKRTVYNFDETKFRFYNVKQTSGIWINTMS